MAQRGNGEGSVYEEGRRSAIKHDDPARLTGRWVAQVKVDGKYKRRFARTEAAAKKLLRDMDRERENTGTLGDGNTTLGQLIEQWRRTVLPARDLSPRTIEVYSWALKVLDAELGSKRLRSLSPEHVESAFRRLSDGPDGLGRPSLIKIRSVLGKVLGYAERRQLVNRNIARVVELPAEARRTPDGRALTVDQARKLLDVAADHRLHALWLTMLYLGLRPGEATGLTWSSIDFDAAAVHVRQSLKLEGGRLELSDRLKTSKSRRSIDAPPEVIAAMRKHRSRQAAERLEAGPLWSNPDDLMFTTTIGSPIDPNNLRRTFARLTERAGLGRWKPHELRHSAASIMSAAGLPLEEVADVLGHDGTRMTALVYRHAVTPTIGGAARVMEGALS